MRIHAPAKIKEIKRLRKLGYSINEIVARLSVPKTTVWHHIQGTKIHPRYVAIWKTKQGGSAKRKLRNWEVARLESQKLLRGPHRELAISLAMLYWCEGNKKRPEFINSDGRMIKIYAEILKKVFRIPEGHIKPTLRIFSGMDRRACLKYWSRVTRIPKTKFLVRLNDGLTRGRTQYGMCRITIAKGSNAYKLIQSLIERSSEEMLEKVTNAPVVQLDRTPRS